MPEWMASVRTRSDYRAASMSMRGVAREDGERIPQKQTPRRRCSLLLQSRRPPNAVFDYLETFYNRQRLHSSLGYPSPHAFLHA